MVIREVKPNELDLLREISMVTFKQAFASQNDPKDMDLYLTKSREPQLVRMEYENPNVLSLFVEHEEKVIGYMKINFGDAQTEQFEQPSIELERIYLLQEHTNQGFGKQMLDHFEAIGMAKKLPMLWLGVWEYNHDARRFYKRHGFVEFGSHDYVLGTDVQRDLLVRKFIH